jgi:archaellum component FlaF (FlaF/FlaG flagellin family)
MGVSVSAAAAIMFTTFVILFGVIFGAVDHFQTSVMESQDQHLDADRDLRGLSISIISVNDTLDNIVLCNDGQTTILLDDLDVLLDGVFLDRSNYNTTVSGISNTMIWGPTENMTISLDGDLDGMRIKVTVKGWASAYYGP